MELNQDNLKTNNMGGLARICRIYGSMEFSDDKGKKVTWLWDYVKEEPRLKSEMTKEEIKASEKSKWMKIKEQMNENKNIQDFLF